MKSNHLESAWIAPIQIASFLAPYELKNKVARRVCLLDFDAVWLLASDRKSSNSGEFGTILVLMEG